MGIGLKHYIRCKNMIINENLIGRDVIFKHLMLFISNYSINTNLANKFSMSNAFLNSKLTNLENFENIDEY